MDASEMAKLSQKKQRERLGEKGYSNMMRDKAIKSHRARRANKIAKTERYIKTT